MAELVPQALRAHLDKALLRGAETVQHLRALARARRAWAIVFLPPARQQAAVREAAAGAARAAAAGPAAAGHGIAQLRGGAGGGRDRTGRRARRRLLDPVEAHLLRAPSEARLPRRCVTHERMRARARACAGCCRSTAAAWPRGACQAFPDVGALCTRKGALHTASVPDFHLIGQLAVSLGEFSCQIGWFLHLKGVRTIKLVIRRLTVIASPHV